MRVFLQALFATIVFVFVSISTAQSQTYYYLTLVDEDGSAATGCPVEITDGGGLQIMSGVDLLLLATVNNGTLSSVQTASCSGLTIDSSNINTALTWQNDATHPTYTLSGAFIEYRLPGTISINASTAVGFASSTNQDFSVSANNDVLFSSGGNPILLSPLLTRISGVSIPWASPIILLLIALTLGILGARFLRHPHAHRLSAFAFFLCVISLSSAVYSALRITLDGTGSGWSGASLLATADTTGDVSPGEIDLSHVYGALQDNQLHLKLHVVKQPAEPQIPVPAVAEFRLLGADITEPNEQSTITASGDQERIRGAAKQVRIRNITTNAETTATLASGQWQTQIAAKAGDQLELTPINANNEEGGPIYLTVQGTAQEPILPPDPINDPNVAPELNPQDIYTVYDSTKFLYTNNPPIQIGVDPNTIKPKLSSLIVGKVLKRDNTPLSGVTIKIKGHDQYGHTITREDGQLDMVVNGGQWFVVEYSKEGYLPVQRKVQVAWQDYGYLPDVVMIPVDHKVSIIDLRESEDAFQIHQGSISHDADGERQATILFPRGVTATMQLPNGSTQNLDVLNVRATEYTIGENGPNAMPGELPPATGYTYAVELSVDQAIQQGASRVEFSEPLPMYVDNFLDFPVAVLVSLDWYSYERKAWVPNEDGYVIQVLSVNNGVAVLDVKGNGVAATPAELAELNITEEEQQAIARLYPVGKTFWRTRVSHFTPWSGCGRPLGFMGMPQCLTGELCNPLLNGEDDSMDDKEPEPDPDEEETCEGCTIRTQNRSMAEQVDVAGTPLSLHYESRRSKQQSQVLNRTARKLKDDRPFLQEVVNVESKVTVVGRTIPLLSRPASEIADDDMSGYVWDGMDRYRRKLSGSAYAANHTVTFVIQGVYYEYEDRDAAFSSFSQYSNTFVHSGSGRSILFGARNTTRRFLSPPEEGSSAILMQTTDLGSWTLGVHHHYNPISGVLAMGDGMDRTTQSITPQLKEVSGYSVGYKVHSKPMDVEPLPDGGMLRLFQYFNALDNPQTVRVIVQVSAEGVSQELWRGGSPLDGLWPTLIRYDAFNGGIYIIDNNDLIYYRDPDGQITHVAGFPYHSNLDYSGNNDHDPRLIRFGSIDDMTVGHDGALYIVDGWAQCIRKLDADDYITTVVGSCDKKKEEYKPFADGITATSFNHWYPYSVALDRQGHLLIGAEVYIKDGTTFYGHHTVLRVGVGDRVYRIAGINDSARENNERYPLSASFQEPKALATGYHDDLYFSTSSFVRRLYDDKLDLMLGDSEALGSDIPSTEPKHNQFDALNILIKASPMKVDAGGNIYFTSGSGSIFMMASGAPGFDGEEFLIPNNGGTQVYRFSAHGRHLQTLDALTGAVIYTFGYDAEGLLQSVTDFDGRITRIERNDNQAVIVGPYGHRTEITKGANGATAIKNPANETWRFVYDNNGLMVSATTPRGQTSTYTYDGNNRLVTDTWPNGGGWRLSATDEVEYLSISRYQVNLTSGEGRTRSYNIKNETLNWPYRPATTQQRESSVTTPDGLVTSTVNHSVNYSITDYPDGTQSEHKTRGDPRFGVLAPYTSQYLLIGSKNAEGITEANYIQTSRDVETDGNALLPVVRWQESVYHWSDLSSREYVHAEKLWRTTTPSGKETRMTVDGVHRPLRVEQDSIPTTTFTYSQGLVSRMTQTAIDNATSRSWQYSYDAQGNLAQMLDPLNRASTFDYDAVGRPTRQTLPDGRTIETAYDAQGNVKEIKTPAGDVHYYNYDAMGDTQAYTPPAVGAAMVTSYQYDKDRKLTGVTLPDGQVINTTYGQTTGRLLRISSPEADKVPGYDTAGRLTSWSQGTNRLGFTYGSLYPKDTTWSGDVNGVVTTHFDNEGKSNLFNGLYANKGWLDGLSVAGGNGQKKTLAFAYDADGVIKEIELIRADYSTASRYIRFDRNEENNQLAHLYGWNTADRDERVYDNFGAISNYRYNKPSNSAESFSLTLGDHTPSADALRIKGNLSRSGMYNNFERLYIGVAGSEFASTASLAPLADNGYVNVMVNLGGAAGEPKTYRLANTSNGNDWWHDIGAITKTKREALDIDQMLFARDGVIYYPPEDGGYYNYLSKIGRYQIADGSRSTFVIQGEDPSQEMYGELIGIGPEGQMYFAHYDYWNWDCGTPEEGYLLCITEQKEGSPTKSVLAVPYADNENIIMRYVDSHESVPSFYAIRHESFYYGSCADITIDRWDNGEAKQIAKIHNVSPEDPGQCRFHPNDGVAQAAVYGQDLLLMMGYVYEFANTDGIFRIRPSGQVTEIARNGDSWEDPAPLGIFADGNYTCLLRVQDYRCFDENQIVRKQADAPLWVRQISGIPLSFALPVVDESTNTVYYLNHNLWALKSAATVNEIWKDATTGDPLRVATLTIKDDTSWIEEIYGVNIIRDLIGRVTEKEETIDGVAVTQSYTYDTAGRLIKATTNGAEETWTYDANGNRTHRNNQPIATFDVQDRIIEQNGVTYQHNALGQRTGKNQSGQITAYQYDVFGGLKNVTLPDNTQIGYILDPTGRRIGRKENGSWTHKWLYQDSLNPIAELDENDHIRKLFIYSDKANVPSHMITYTAAGTEDKQYRIVPDLLGSVRLVYDLATGNEIQRIDYDVWGNITSDTNPGFQPFGFAGGLYDQKTKLTRFGARDYDAETARWTAKDPIGFNGGDTNLYGYVLNDPVNFIDPYGEVAWVAAGAVIGAAVNVAATYIAAYRAGESVSARQFAAAAVSGAYAGAAGAIAGPLGGSVARALGAASNKAVGAAFAGIYSGIGAGVGQAMANAIDPCNAIDLGTAALYGGLGGGAAKFIPTNNLNTMGQAANFGANSLGGLFRTPNSFMNHGASATSAGLGAAANFPSLSPFSR